MASFVVQNARILKLTHEKPCTFTRRSPPMYQGKDRQTLPLFSELFPFGGTLDPENRWLKIGGALCTIAKKTMTTSVHMSLSIWG